MAAPVGGCRRRTPAGRDRRHRAPATAVRPRAPLPRQETRLGARGHRGGRQRAPSTAAWLWSAPRRTARRRCGGDGWPAGGAARRWVAGGAPGRGLASQWRGRPALAGQWRRRSALACWWRRQPGNRRGGWVPTLPAALFGWGVSQRQAARRVARGFPTRTKSDSRRSLALTRATCTPERGVGRGGQRPCISQARPVGRPRGRCSDGTPPGRWRWMPAPWVSVVSPRQRRQCAVDGSPLAPLLLRLLARCAQSGALEKMQTSGRRIESLRQRPRPRAAAGSRDGACVRPNAAVSAEEDLRRGWGLAPSDHLLPQSRHRLPARPHPQPLSYSNCWPASSRTDSAHLGSDRAEQCWVKRKKVAAPSWGPANKDDEAPTYRTQRAAQGAHGKREKKPPASAGVRPARGTPLAVGGR